MSYADDIFIQNCKDILQHGVSSEGQLIRAKWPDGAPAHTIKMFGIVNRYDLQEFPAMTLRPVRLKSVVGELLWIWQKKSNVVSELNSKIWDAWKMEDGTIGESYGAQLSKVHKYPEGNFDQVDRLLYDLKHNPQSRRMVTNMYTHADLHAMALYPCAFGAMFNVTDGKLNTTVLQRSNDMLVANNWDLVQYAVLTHMLAMESDLQVGELVHVINDAHIYDRHISIVEELISRPAYAPPRLVINKKPFYKLTVDDFTLEDYEAGPQIKFEVAI
jgi:thymidylate synthase